MSHATYDRSGFLTGFQYHDGLLDGVMLGENGAVLHLSIRAASGEPRVVSLRRVRALDIQNFVSGNIILTMRVMRPLETANDADWREIYANRLFIDPMHLSPDALVFRLESSIGADVVAICHDVEVSEIGRTLMVGPRQPDGER